MDTILQNLLNKFLTGKNEEEILNLFFDVLKEKFHLEKSLILDKLNQSNKYIVVKESNTGYSLIKTIFNSIESLDFEQGENDVKNTGTRKNNKEFQNIEYKYLCAFKYDNKILVCFSNKDLSKNDIDTIGILFKYTHNHIKDLATKNSLSLNNSILQEQNSKLQQIENVRSTYLNNLIHELKNPLTSVLGFSKLLLSSEFDSNKQRDFLEQIHNSATRLEELLNDLLQINKLESGGWFVRWEESNIVNIVKQSVEDFSSLYEDYNINFSTNTTEAHLKTDPKLIRQVIDNLLSNAIKYSPASKTINISTTKKHNDLEVSITDNGIGIQKEELSKIFNRFYRVKTKTTENISGSGLGLSICKSIADLLNCEITIDSEINKGTKVNFLIRGT